MEPVLRLRTVSLAAGLSGACMAAVVRRQSGIASVLRDD